MAQRTTDLAGKVAVVTGGTSGIGRALSLGLARAGADVVATSRDRVKVAEVARELRESGARTLEQVSDVRDTDSLVALRDAACDALGQVDILVCAAGRTQRKATLEQSVAEFESILDTNLTGTFRACQVFGASMLARGQGRIINIASLSSFVGFHEVAAYTASKAAVVGLTRALAVEWGPRGVLVNAIAPGVFPTELNRSLLEGTPRGEELIMRTPLARFGRVEELAGAVVFLASERSSFINGEVLTVDGGFLASGVNR